MPRESVPGDLLPPDASAVIGGRLGRRAAGRARSLRHLVPVIVAMVFVPMAAAVLRQGHCVAQGWNGDEQFWRGCFSDLPAQYQLAGLDAGLTGWFTSGQEPTQMPLVSGLMALLGGFVPADSGWLEATRWYFAMWTVLIALCAVVGVWCVARTRPQRLDLATQLALSPVYVVAALLSADLVVVVLVLAAVLASSCHRATTAGILLGLALTGHAWVGIVLLALLVSSRRLGGREEAVRTAAIALGTAVGIGIVLLVLAPEVVTGPFTSWWHESAGYGSVLRIPALVGHALPGWISPAVALLGWLVAAAGAVVMDRRAWRPATWAQVAAFAVPVVALTGTSVPVQAALWVLPLAILAGVSWRTHLGFVAVEAVHATALWVYIGGMSDPDVGLPAQWYAVVVLGRTIAWGFLLWSVWYTPVDNPVARPQAPVTPAPSPQEPARA
ncbi:hypothetical protein [Janibacter cremeus]|uniref:Putative membrane protein n=1 Tax=Janibacter cremeus TaxID=1285192 RepID=A0A852VXL2_9MICO|nr:hypothetical protein [Janibacter cremeus]NYF98261.1 putative membrane protein [Janibacter cremeus]